MATDDMIGYQRLPFARERARLPRRPTVEERLARRKEQRSQRKRCKAHVSKRQGSLLHRIIKARVLLKQGDPARYNTHRESFIISPAPFEDMADVASIHLVDETKDKPRSRANSTSSNSGSVERPSNSKISGTGTPTGAGARSRLNSTSSNSESVERPSTSKSSATPSGSGNRSSLNSASSGTDSADRTEVSTTHGAVTSSSDTDERTPPEKSSAGAPTVIAVEAAPDSDTPSQSSESSLSSRGMPAEEFNRRLSLKRSGVVHAMLENTVTKQDDDYQKSREKKAEQALKRTENERKKEERLRGQALRGQVADEFTRVRYCLPYYAEKSAESETQVVRAVLRLALRKPQARYRLGQLIAHFRGQRSDPVRPATGASSASSDEWDGQFVEDLETLIKDVAHDKRPGPPARANPADKFPVPDVYSVKPLPDDITGNAEAASVDRKNSQDYVRALEQVVDNNLAKVIADNSRRESISKKGAELTPAERKAAQATEQALAS